jgi:hypothetical protein
MQVECLHSIYAVPSIILVRYTLWFFNLDSAFLWATVINSCKERLFTTALSLFVFTELFFKMIDIYINVRTVYVRLCEFCGTT